MIEHGKAAAANIITVSRMLFSLLLLFLLPLSVSFADVKYGAAIVCIAATATVIREITDAKRYKSWL